MQEEEKPSGQRGLQRMLDKEAEDASKKKKKIPCQRKNVERERRLLLEGLEGVFGGDDFLRMFSGVMGLEEFIGGSGSLTDGTADL